MKAVILCAGLGTRLRPLTDTIPKVMVPIGDKPLLQYHIEWLVKNGITDIGINLFYLPESIVNHFGDGSLFGARIFYSHQKELLEPATGFKNFEQFVGDDQCLVIYGDNIFELDLNEMRDFHNAKKGIATIALKEWEDPTTKGIVGLDTNAQILYFKEKPKKEEVTSTIGNAGIYIIEKELFDYIPPQEVEVTDFGKHIFPALLKKQKAMYGYILKGYHRDIGTHDMLQAARKEISFYPNLA